MLFLDQALEQLEELAPEAIFIINSDEVIRAVQQVGEKYGVSFDAALVFCLVGELMSDDLPNYFEREFEFDSSTAKAAAKDFIEQVLEPLTRRLLFLDADPDKKGMTQAQEKNILREMFAGKIISELKNPFMIKHAVNLRIFDILESDENFKRDLARVLLANSEQLTSKNITVAGKSVPATVGNWLADYISVKGGEVFDSVSLSDYLANSANARSLAKEDKFLVGDTIQLYRNLQLFPQSTENKPIDDWQILPYSSDEVTEFEHKFKEFEKKRAEREQAEKEQPSKQEEAASPAVESETVKPMAAAESPKPVENVPVDMSKSKGNSLANYDWPNINGLERRLLLEELGVNRQELEEYLKSK